MLGSKKFLLVGSPNTGKTTLFNALTGLHQRTANYAGVTVEKFTGWFQCQDTIVEIVDLPGIYSLYPNSLDEWLAVQELLTTSYDGLIVVTNADQLQKNLLLVLQLIDLKKPIILVLNMVDEIRKKNINIDFENLKELLQSDIVFTNARTGEGVDELKSKLSKIQISKSVFYEPSFLQNLCQIDASITTYKQWISYYSNHYEKDPLLQKIVEKDLDYKTSIVHYIANRTIQRKILFKQHQEKLDRILTHKIGGFVFLFITLLFVFQLVFFLAELPMKWIEWSMDEISKYLQTQLPDTKWASLIIDGILPGITGVIMFVPQIALLFLMIGILEESGYMARISFLLDSIFNRLGLSGRSLIPLVGGVACAVPSILATRTITNVKEKLITVMVLPFMSCSARLPVYTLLISLIFPEDTYYAFFNLKGLVLLGLYLLGLWMALLYAFLFNKTIREQKANFFFIELPPYKIPYWKNLFVNVWNKVKIFISDAGKIIMAISIVLWYLSSHTLPSIEKQLQHKYETLKEKVHNKDSLENQYKAELLEKSYAGKIGKLIEPLIRPLGYDWKIGIALITSFAAREVFVGTMATLYSASADEQLGTLRDKIKIARHADNQELVFTLATNISLLIYYALAMQCISTMVIVYRELRSIKWVLIQFFIMTGTAYLLAYTAYHILS